MLFLALCAVQKSQHLFGPQQIHYSWGYFAPSGAALGRLLAMADAGALKPNVDRVFPLSAIHSAVQHASGQTVEATPASGATTARRTGARGKVVLDLTK